MSVFLEIAALLLVVDDNDLGRAADLGQSGGYGSFGNERRTDSGVLAVINEKDFVEGDSVAFLVFTDNLLNRDNIALGDGVLLASGLNNCKFHNVKQYTGFPYFRKGRVAY